MKQIFTQLMKYIFAVFIGLGIIVTVSGLYLFYLGVLFGIYISKLYTKTAEIIKRIKLSNFPSRN